MERDRDILHVLRYFQRDERNSDPTPSSPSTINSTPTNHACVGCRCISHPNETIYVPYSLWCSRSDPMASFAVHVCRQAPQCQKYGTSVGLDIVLAGRILGVSTRKNNAGEATTMTNANTFSPFTRLRCCCCVPRAHVANGSREGGEGAGMHTM